MNEKKHKEYVNWVSATLEAQRNNISDLLSRLRGVVYRVSNGLSLHKKFMRLMDQVVVEREKELDIIHEIEAVEKRHLALKKHKLLRRANSATEERRQQRLNKKNLENEQDEENLPERSSLAEFLALYWLFFSRSGRSFSFFSFFSREKPISVEPTPQSSTKKVEPEVK